MTIRKSPRKTRALAAASTALLSLTVASGAALADDDDRSGRGVERAWNHVGSFDVPANLAPDEAPTTLTSAEILDVSKDGKTLVYTDSLAGRVGFVDIGRPAQPLPLGFIDMGGEPTSVAIQGRYALVGVNTSQSFDEPSGELVVLDVSGRNLAARIELAGQPDSIAVSPDGKYAAIVIENERDEDENGGLLPQKPPGLLQVLELRGNPERWELSNVDLTKIADVAPSDPEPEFVDINDDNLAVVSLQENNHLIVVDLETKQVVNDFSAGSVTISDIDATEEELGPQEQGLIQLTETITRRREPDAVAWIDHDTFVTANEGDYEDEAGEEGGSRSFTLFNIDGSVEYEAGNSFEHEVVRAGHFPQGRAANKGSEPEGLEVTKIGDRTYLFVGAERANVVGVYDVTDGMPKFKQLLPTAIGPEGIKAIPQRRLLAVSGEVDGLDDGFDIRAMVTLYSLDEDAPKYPMLISADEAGVPIPWVAISGLAGDPTDNNIIYAVSDSFLAQGYIYRINVEHKPAVIESRMAVGEADGALDLEGIAVSPQGGFWLASEGRTEARDNALLHFASDGTIEPAEPLPSALTAFMTNSGFEGVAATLDDNGNEVLYAVIQREWGDDPAGMVKIGRYDVSAKSWTFAHYPLDPKTSPNGGWVGLSEITALPDGKLAILERDNQLAGFATIKRIYTIDPCEVTFVPYGAEGEALPIVTKTLMRDLLGALAAHSISVPDKVEGLALTADGQLYVATDNDGVDENYGETLLFALGRDDQDGRGERGDHEHRHGGHSFRADRPWF